MTGKPKTWRERFGPSNNAEAGCYIIVLLGPLLVAYMILAAAIEANSIIGLLMLAAGHYYSRHNLGLWRSALMGMGTGVLWYVLIGITLKPLVDFGVELFLGMKADIMPESVVRMLVSVGGLAIIVALVLAFLRYSGRLIPHAWRQPGQTEIQGQPVRPVE